MTDQDQEAFRTFLAQHVYKGYGRWNLNRPEIIAACWCGWSALATQTHEGHERWAAHVAERWGQR